MTINLSDNSPRVSYNVAEGVSQSAFVVSFEFFDNDDLNVYVDGTLKTITTDYTVTGGDGSTGTVTFVSAVVGASGGSTVVITRDIDLDRTTDFPSSGPFNIASLNTELDRFVAIAADLKDQADRALQLTDFDAAASLTLPEVDDRKGTVLAFNETTGAVEAGPTTSNVNSLAAVTDDIATLADIEDGTDATDAIQTVASISSDVATVSGISSNVSTVAGITANIASVVADEADIGTVAGSISNVNTVAGIDGNVTTVAGISANVTTVAGVSANVSTVAGISSDVTTAAGISADITTVAADGADIGTVAGISSDVTTVAGISGNVTTVAGQTTNLQNVTDNLSAIQNAAANATNAADSASSAAASALAAAISADTFDDTYLGSKASDPILDNDGDALNAGDLYFNTTANALKVYNGSSWQAAALDSSGFITTSADADIAGTLTMDGLNVDGDVAIASNLPVITLTDNDNSSSRTDINYNFGYFQIDVDANQVDAAEAFRVAIGGTKHFEVSTGGDISFYEDTGTTAKLFWDAGDETLTIGDALNNAPLSLETNTSGYAISLEENAGAETWQVGVDSTGDLNFYNSQGANPAVTFADNNFVGINTASPSGVLHVSATNPDVYITSADTGQSDIYLGGTTSPTKGRIQYSDNSDFMAFWTDSAQRMTIDSSGNVGIGTSSPNEKLVVSGNASVTGALQITSNTSAPSAGAALFRPASNTLGFVSNSAERMRIDSSGNVGIGSTSPTSLGTGMPTIELKGNSTSQTDRSGGIRFERYDGNYAGSIYNADGAFYMETGAYPFILRVNGSERARINTSGNVGIGTQSPVTKLHVAGNAILGAGSTNPIAFTGSSAQNAGMGSYNANTDLNLYSAGTAAIKFRTGAVWSSSATLTSTGTERARLESGGNFAVGQTSGIGAVTASTNGSVMGAAGYAMFQRTNAIVGYFNRNSTDGEVIRIYGQGTFEGGISVSGTTVSYNGGHLSRWSQLADNTKDTSIVKGTVMTNLDQMAVWHHEAVEVGDDILDVDGNVIGQAEEAKAAYDEDNEQLNCMAVSSVEGDPNVAGVFVNWDTDDTDFENDMNIAMTGDFVIRIAQGTTVARGDLLMSAGDGTAKPQGDDIVRSKTIAKVTSTNVSHTYDDGSYLVPCVLMAC